MRGLRDAEWGTELGRLYLEKTITPEMYSAGKRWRSEAAQYRAAIGVFPVRAVSLERGVKSHPPDSDSEEGQRQRERELDAAERFFAAHTVLSVAGAEIIVRRLCEDDESLAGLLEYTVARKGLSKLFEHYRLTDKEKSGNANGR